MATEIVVKKLASPKNILTHKWDIIWDILCSEYHFHESIRLQPPHIRAQLILDAGHLYQELGYFVRWCLQPLVQIRNNNDRRIIHNNNNHIRFETFTSTMQRNIVHFLILNADILCVSMLDDLFKRQLNGGIDGIAVNLLTLLRIRLNDVEWSDTSAYDLSTVRCHWKKRSLNNHNNNNNREKAGEKKNSRSISTIDNKKCTLEGEGDDEQEPQNKHDEGKTKKKQRLNNHIQPYINELNELKDELQSIPIELMTSQGDENSTALNALRILDEINDDYLDEAFDTIQLSEMPDEIILFVCKNFVHVTMSVLACHSFCRILHRKALALKRVCSRNLVDAIEYTAKLFIEPIVYDVLLPLLSLDSDLLGTAQCEIIRRITKKFINAKLATIILEKVLMNELIYNDNIIDIIYTLVCIQELDINDNLGERLIEYVCKYTPQYPKSTFLAKLISKLVTTYVSLAKKYKSSLMKACETLKSFMTRGIQTKLRKLE